MARDGIYGGFTLCPSRCPVDTLGDSQNTRRKWCVHELGRSHSVDALDDVMTRDAIRGDFTFCLRFGTQFSSGYSFECH